MNNNRGFELLLEKLNAFIRKYYTNQLIKGALLFVGLVIGFFLSIITLEYFFFFDIPIRVILFYGFLAVSIWVGFQYLAKPLLGMYNLKGGNVLGYDKAAQIIGKAFPTVKDKVTNTLQLKELADKDPERASLILASIDQRIAEIQPVPFQMAVKFSENKKYIKYALIPFLILLIVSFTLPDLVSDGTKRLVNNTQPFEKPQPFYFQLVNEGDLLVEKGDDLQLQVETQGEITPEQAYVFIDETRFKLKRQKSGLFSYSLKNLQANKSLYFQAGDVRSPEYEVNVLPKPTLIDLVASLEFPDYTAKQTTEVRNNGDLVVPEGTTIRWDFQTNDVDRLLLEFDTLFSAKRTSKSSFQIQKQIFKNQGYSVRAYNEKNQNPEEIQYTLSIIPDRYPEIKIEKVPDTITNQRIYFSGEIADDYGFSRLAFHYTHKGKKVVKELQVNPDISNQRFYYNWNFSALSLAPGDELVYYFEVWDNDGVNGLKSSRSSSFVHRLPSKKEIAKASEQKSEQIKEEMEAAISEVKNLQKEVEDLSKKLIDKKRIGWEEKKQLQRLMQQRKSLEGKVNELKTKNLEKNSLQKELSPSAELLEKQRQLEELFEKIMDDDMKKMMEEMEKLMDQLDKNELKKNLEDFQLSNEDMEKELDRTLELFKQFEFEQKLEQTIEQLKELEKKQEELKQETQDENTNAEDLNKKQEELNKEAEDLEKSLEDLKKKNEALEKPNEMPDMSPDMEKLKEQMKDASDALQNQEKKKASDSQNNAQEKMQQMQQKMEEMKQGMMMEQQSENLEDMRQLLENLIQLSFDQENLMERVKTLQRNDPAYVTANQEQKKIKDHAEMIEDSLFALSKRVAQIQATVNREINAINANMEKAINALIARNSKNAASRQQFVMTSVNNLALLLDEVVQNMQQNLSSMKFGKSSCNKPGSGMPSPGDLKKAQQQLNEQMKKMLEQMQQGKMPNGQKPGGEKGQGSSMSKEVAKMAAEQAAIREAVKQLQQQLEEQNEGKGGNGNLKKIEELMEQTEEDLVNFNLSKQTLKRQEEIITRLLESEKAEREREYDNKRESKEANELEKRADDVFEEYQKQKQKELELLKTVPPNLNNYYRNKVTKYLNEL